MHFIHEQQPPFPAADLVHHFCTLLTPLPAEGNHGVCGNGHSTGACQALLLV